MFNYFLKLQYVILFFLIIWVPITIFCRCYYFFYINSFSINYLFLLQNLQLNTSLINAHLFNRFYVVDSYFVYTNIIVNKNKIFNENLCFYNVSNVFNFRFLIISFFKNISYFFLKRILNNIVDAIVIFIFLQKNNFCNFCFSIKICQNITTHKQSVIWYKKTIFIQNNGNFVPSLRKAGLKECDINEIYQALQWQLDLSSLCKGDQFSLLMSCRRFGKDQNCSSILGLKLNTKNKDYYAFRYKDGEFCNRSAICFSGVFLRFPLSKKFRISSVFNMRRLNPVTGRIAPHCGVDFAVPIGTPVLSVGDGEVIISKYGGISTGNYITILHRCHCITRYMHLKKNLVHPGQKVKMGENIALSGNTGRTTGPHLHFEIWINKRAVNPLTAKLIHIRSLNGSDRIFYLSQVEQMLSQF